MESASIKDRFAAIEVDSAPGQEVRHSTDGIRPLLRGAPLEGRPVDFSHGDVDAFAPAPGAQKAFDEAVAMGGAQAYTEYRGSRDIRDMLAPRLAAFTGAALSPEDMIIAPGTQGALFLALASVVGQGDRIAIVEPDYFANRKIALFLGAEIVPVTLDYLEADGAGIDLTMLEDALRSGVRALVFSNPNNPAGVVYSPREIARIAELADHYGATVICDQLYSRLLYEGESYTHLRAVSNAPEHLITIMGPSKTESLSGYRLGVAFGAPEIIARMEKLQAIVSLRAAGYAQRVLTAWMAEPDGWMAERVAAHQAIRDDLLSVLGATRDVRARMPQAGSYLFANLPRLAVSGADFVQILREQAGVTVTPGSEFAPAAANGIRVNYSQDHAAAVAAMHRTVTLIDRYRV